MAFEVASIYTAIGTLFFVINTDTLSSVDDIVISNVTNRIQESRRNIHLSKRSINERTCRNINRCGISYPSCHCDDLCNYYKDCCWDHTPNNARALSDSVKRSCVALDTPKTFYFAVSGCPDGYGDVEITAKCTKSMPQIEMDPLMIIPAFDRATKILYQNRYCATCNGATDIVPYNVFVEGFEDGCQRPDTSSPMEVLKYFLREDSSCSVAFTTTEIVNQRRCYTNLISKCSSDNSSLKDECEAGVLNPLYVTIALDRDNSKVLDFRNYHCYKCSAEYPAGTISCTEGSSYGIFPMRVLVDASDLIATSSTDTSLCGDGQIYDYVYVRHFFHFKKHHILLIV